MVDKLRTDLYVLYIVTGTSVTPLKIAPINKRNMKSLATPPQRKDPIPHQDIHTLGTGKDQSLPPHLPKFFHGYKSLRNESDDDRHDSTDTPRTDKEGYIYNIKAMNNKNSDGKYKEEHLQH